MKAKFGENVLRIKNKNDIFTKKNGEEQKGIPMSRSTLYRPIFTGLDPKEAGMPQKSGGGGVK